MFRVCPFKLKISSLPTKEEKKKEGWLRLWQKDSLYGKKYQNKLIPEYKKRDGRPKPSPPSRLGMNHQVRMKPNTRGLVASIDH